MKILMFHSYKGGSGKTLFSINTAMMLAEKYKKKVLLIEADFDMPVFSRVFSQYNIDMYFNDYLDSNINSLHKYIYSNNQNKPDIIFCDPNVNTATIKMKINLNYYRNKINQLEEDFEKLEYDYIIFDLAPGKHLFSVAAVYLSNYIFIMMRPDPYSLEGTKWLLKEFYSNISRLSSKSIVSIMNQIPEHPEVDSIIDQWIIIIESLLKNISPTIKIPFNVITGYNIINTGTILPLSDPTRLQIDKIIMNSF